jgi:hypothetical protein
LETLWVHFDRGQTPQWSEGLELEENPTHISAVGR